MAYTLIIISLVAILLTASLRVVVSNINFGLNREAKEQSLQVAEAGIYFYKWYLAHQVSGMTTKQVRQFWDSGAAYGVDEPYKDDFEGIGTYSIRVKPPEDSSTIIEVESTGWTTKNINLKRTVKVRFRQPSWSEYVVLCDSDIEFKSGTDIVGAVHSNKGIRFDGVAHNIVSSSIPSYNDPSHGGPDEYGVHTHVSPDEKNLFVNGTPVPNRSDVFLAGREFPAPIKDFDSVLIDLADMKSESGCANVGSYCSGDSEGALVSANGVYFNGANHGRHIVLRADGMMEVSRVLNMASNEIKTESTPVVYPIPDEGVIFVEDDVWVEGIIDNKRITIVSANLTPGNATNMYIKRDIVYTNYNGDDAIGLVSQGNIDTLKDSENDLRIDGAMLATTGKVGRIHSGGDYKDNITIYGAIVTRLGYGFSFDDGTGYSNINLVYDNNLLYSPPPYFPTGTNYTIDSWEEL